MGLTILTLIAIISAAIFILNILFLAVAKENWMNLVRKLYSNSKLVLIVTAILSIVFLKILLEELTITNIFAVMAFTRFLSLISNSENEYLFVELSRKVLNPSSKLEDWFELFIWAFFSLGVLYENWNLIVSIF